jgi:dethiobiotin synthetase
VTGRLVVVSGTGTEIGKTHFAVALLRALGRKVPRVTGLKPIESGVTDPTATDAARLRAESTFHVKPFGYSLGPGLSPHLAARLEGRTLELESVLSGVAAARSEADAVVVELPGGLFSPLRDGFVNADLVRELHPDRTLIVVPDRLGALHDAIATQRAADAVPIPVDGFVLATPEAPDASTGLNALELQLFVGVPIVAVLPRASIDVLADLDAMARLAEYVIGPLGPERRIGPPRHGRTGLP